MKVCKKLTLWPLKGIKKNSVAKWLKQITRSVVNLIGWRSCALFNISMVFGNVLLEHLMNNCMFKQNIAGQRFESYL